MIDITPHPRWIESLLEDLKQYQDRVVNSRLFCDVGSNRLTKRRAQSALVNFYPLVESFPQFMALSLAKVPAGNSEWNRKTRHWLITNINQERLHANWWRRMAHGFGVPQHALSAEVYPPPAMDAINNYLWRICTHGSLAEGIAAANFAVEGPTGEWTKRVKEGFERYSSVEGMALSKEALQWIDAHAHYDDKHPIEALEIVKTYATTEQEQEKVKQAAKRALEYYALALETCYEM